MPDAQDEVASAGRVAHPEAGCARLLEALARIEKTPTRADRVRKMAAALNPPPATPTIVVADDYVVVGGVRLRMRVVGTGGPPGAGSKAPGAASH